MLKFINRFEKLVYILLIAFLVIVLVFAIGQMFWSLWNALKPSPAFNLDSLELSTALGGFLLVLIAVELLDTMKAYIVENVIHVEVVVLLAIIAIARKVILLNPQSPPDGVELIGLGILIVGLAASYYLIRKAGIAIGSGLVKPPEVKPPQTE